MLYSSNSIALSSRLFVGEAHFFFYKKGGAVGQQREVKMFLFEKLYHTELAQDDVLSYVGALGKASSYKVTSFALVQHHFTSLDTSLVYGENVFRTYAQAHYDQIYVDQAPKK